MNEVWFHLEDVGGSDDGNDDEVSEMEQASGHKFV
jgi:hypothetical protein